MPDNYFFNSVDDAEELTKEVLGQKRKLGMNRRKSVAAIRSIQETRRKMSVGGRSRTHTGDSSVGGTKRSGIRYTSMLLYFICCYISIGYKY